MFLHLNGAVAGFNEEFVKFPEFYKEYGREDITLDSMRAVVKEFSRRAIRGLQQI